MRKEARERIKPELAIAPAGAADSRGMPMIYMASSDDQPPKRTVRGQRRRPGSDRPSSGRADAPTRDDRPAGSSGGGGSYRPASGGGMSGIPGGMRGAAGGGGMLLALCAIIAYMMFGGGGGDGQDPFNTGGGLGPSQNQEEFDLSSGLESFAVRNMDVFKPQ